MIWHSSPHHHACPRSTLQIRTITSIDPKLPQTHPVLVYVVDTGAEPRAGEFIRKSGEYDGDGNLLGSNAIKDWLYPEDSEVSQSDYHPKGHETCVTSWA